MDLNLILLSFIVCIKLKCNRSHIYGLNSDLRIQKAIGKEKNNCNKAELLWQQNQDHNQNRSPSP
jgi:hypothetical protein